MAGETAILRRYAGHLAGRLTGSRRRRAEILDEVMDGLRCATESHLSSCPDPAEAARRAVREWGDPDAVARAYNDATLRLSARRLSLRAVCVLPALAACWAVALLGSPPAPWSQHPPALVFALSVAVLGGAACLAGWCQGRGLRAAIAERAGTGAALAAITGLMVVMSAAAVLLLQRGIPHPESLNWRLVPLPAALTVLTGAYFGTSLQRFLSVARHA